MATNGPLSAAAYRLQPILQPPSDWTTAQLESVINQAWAAIEAWLGQPMTEVAAQVDVYPMGREYVNADNNGYLHIFPRYRPLNTVASVKYSQNIGQDGWTANAQYDVIGAGDLNGGEIIVYDNGLFRGDFGFVQVTYDYGFGGSSGPTWPNALLQAAILETADLLGMGMYPTEAGAEVAPARLPDTVKAAIIPYKRIW